MMLLTSGVFPIGLEQSTASAEARTVTKSASYMTTYVTKKEVDMKVGRHSKSKTVTRIPKGKKVSHVKSYGSWTQVKYGAKTRYVPTSSLGDMKKIKIKTAEEFTLEEKERIVSATFKKTEGDKTGGQYELTHLVQKTGETHELATAGIDFDTSKGIIFMDVLWYNTAYDRPLDFGKEAQKEAEKMYNKYNRAIYALATVTIGNQYEQILREEFERFFRIQNQLPRVSGTVKLTKVIGGKKVTFKAEFPSYVIHVE